MPGTGWPTIYGFLGLESRTIADLAIARIPNAFESGTTAGSRLVSLNSNCIAYGEMPKPRGAPDVVIEGDAGELGYNCKTRKILGSCTRRCPAHDQCSLAADMEALWAMTPRELVATATEGPKDRQFSLLNLMPSIASSLVNDVAKNFTFRGSGGYFSPLLYHLRSQPNSVTQSFDRPDGVRLQSFRNILR